MNDSRFVVEKFLEVPQRIDMGAGKLSKRYDTDIETIVAAKKEARAVLKGEIKWNGLPKVLIFDIETSPLMAYVWQSQVWNARISNDFVVSEWFMLTWSAKWLFDDDMISARLTRKEVLAEDDSRITKGIWELLDKADIVIAHNGKKFDIPNLQTRFLVHSLLPTRPYRQIDTLLVARREFGFTHNNLNAISKVLGLGEKIDTNFKLWKDCITGSNKALEEMEKYNEHDVRLLEEVYLALLPWIKSHPNIGLYVDCEGSVCASCGSQQIEKHGMYCTNVSKFQAYKCAECGAISRARVNGYDKDLRKKLIAPIAR